MQGCLLSSSAVGVLALEGSHVRDTGSTLSHLLLPVWSCSDAETAALGVRGHLKRTRVQATLPWLSAASAAGVERRTACSAHAAVFHLGAGSWTVDAMVIETNAQEDAAATARALALTHAVHALCLPLKHTRHVMCTISLSRCNVAQLPCGVRALGAVRLSVAQCGFTGCSTAIDHVMTSRAMQRSTEIPHSALLPAAWACTLDVRGCTFDGSGSSNACAVRCRWLCLIERLRPGTKATAVSLLPQQHQPLLAAVGGGGPTAPGSGTAAAAAADSEQQRVPVMIHDCSFAAPALEFVGSVAELPVAFAKPVFPSFAGAVVEASAWCARRARADSAWAAAVVSRCRFNGALQSAGQVTDRAAHADGAAAPSSAVPAAEVEAEAGVCVRLTADVALALCDCVFGGSALTRHAVRAARAKSPAFKHGAARARRCDACVSGVGGIRSAADGQLPLALRLLRGRGAVCERRRAFGSCWLHVRHGRRRGMRRR